ncbi:MAG: FHA domain-containing protein, partial [Clostridiales bacterium]|nr:FHA domain-containing protein [Clostridiales bacterium]
MENEFNYMGMEPYAAVLFAAEDRERALPWMERLVTEGYRVWSAAGSDDEAMSEETAARIKDAELLFWIITAGTARSHLFRSMMDHAVLIGKKTYAYLDGSPDFMPLSMKLEMTVLSCELVGEPGNAQSSLDAVCGIPELRRCRSGPSPASKRPSDRQQENGPREDVRTDGQYGPYGQEDILPDDMTGTTARTEAAFPDEQNDRTEKIGEVPKPVLLFRLRDRSCLCFRLRVIRLGRSRKRCDVCLEDNAKISGYHADLQLKNGSVYLRDVGSTN